MKWDLLISKDRGLSAAELYLRLLLAKKDFLETLNVKEYVFRISVMRLFEKLQSMFSPNMFFYNVEDLNIAEIYLQSLIETDLESSNYKGLSTIYP